MTEVTIREKYRDTLRSIVASLGFAAGDYSQVHEYFVEQERAELRTSYLKGTLLDGTKETRAYGIQTLPSYDAFAISSDYFRTEYETRIRFYYDVGVNGSGANLITRHRVLMVAAIQALGGGLGGITDATLTLQLPEPTIIKIAGMAIEDEQVLVGDIIVVDEFTGDNFS